MWFKKLEDEFGSNYNAWPTIGCGKRLIPLKKGPSMVLEIKGPTGAYEAYLAEQMPTIVDN